MKEIVSFFSENKVASSFLERNCFSVIYKDDSLFLHNGHCMFQVYGHQGAVFMDVLNPGGKEWGWDASSLAQEFLSQERISEYWSEAKGQTSGHFFEINGIETELIAVLLILDREFADLLGGDFSSYKKMMSAMTPSQLETAQNVIIDCVVCDEDSVRGC